MTHLNLDDLDPRTRFALLATIRGCISLRQSISTLDQYLEFCKGVWETVEQNGDEALENKVMGYMMADLLKGHNGA